MAGKVYFVGAGPGSTDYLTLRGRDLLATAEVLAYDALADDRLLDFVPPTCQRLDVGKRGGRVSPSQAEIDRLLVEYCGRGKRVVRLKGGDPFVFGRCTSEIAALEAAGYAYEVVPGISAALAAPLLAGIPLTDATLGRTFAVASGHDPDSLDWEALGRIDTLIILMGGRNLETICDRLVRCGRSPQTPIAIVKWAGRPEQTVWRGTLETIVDRVAGEKLSPTVMAIGEVAKLNLLVS